MKKRNTAIDILRVIGILSVIAAHSEVGQPFYALREYDVVMLMFASGMSAALSMNNHPEERYGAYVVKRFRRLLVPVYLFLVVFFLFFKVILKYPFDLMTIAKSFALVAGGIMYVWVYRVFFTTALLNPLFQKLMGKIGGYASLLVSAMVLLVNSTLYGMVQILPYAKILEYAVTYTLGYGMMGLAGMAFMKMEHRERVLGIVLYLMIFLFGLRGYGFESLQMFKHPPMLYYASYGILVSMVLAEILEAVRIPELSVLSWFSTNAMTVYLWHIVYYYLLVGGPVRLLNLHGLPLFAVITVLSGISAFVQSFVKRRVLK